MRSAWENRKDMKRRRPRTKTCERKQGAGRERGTGKKDGAGQSGRVGRWADLLLNFLVNKKKNLCLLTGIFIFIITDMFGFIDTVFFFLIMSVFLWLHYCLFFPLSFKLMFSHFVSFSCHLVWKLHFIPFFSDYINVNIYTSLSKPTNLLIEKTKWQIKKYI